MQMPLGNYLLPGIYSVQLRHWLRSFPLEQFYVTTSKSFGEATADEMRRIGRHMGLSERELAAASEASLGERKRVGRKEAGGTSAARQKVGGTATSGAALSSSLSVQQRRELEAFYAPYNAELSRLLGREIHW